jgi:hypothetical protein
LKGIKTFYGSKFLLLLGVFLEMHIPRRYKTTSKTVSLQVFYLVLSTNTKIHGAVVIWVVLGLNFALIATGLNKACHGFLTSFRSVAETRRV